MNNYRISSNMYVHNVADYFEDGIPEQYMNGYYVLYDAVRDKDLLINETVKYFIDKFSTPASQEQIINEVKLEVKNTGKEVEETCASFFKFLIKRKIIVPEFDDESAISGEPLFDKGEVLDGLALADLISNKKHVDIYLGHDQIKNCYYVIKLLNAKKFRNIDSYNIELVRLRREYDVLVSANHIPFVSKAYNFTQVENQYAYFTQEWIEGKALSKFLLEVALTEKDHFTIIHHILQAFSALHAANIIHGDIHSSNVLISSDLAVKIIDLGLSRSVTRDKNEVLKFGGVDQYMPPERINGSSIKKHTKEPNLRSDVYQIGLLVYITMYSKTPFEGFTWEELAQNIKNEEVAFPEMSYSHFPVPAEIITIMKKCLNKNSGERYNEASEILKDFRRTLITSKEALIANLAEWVK